MISLHHYSSILPSWNQAAASLPKETCFANQKISRIQLCGCSCCSAPLRMSMIPRSSHLVPSMAACWDFTANRIFTNYYRYPCILSKSQSSRQPNSPSTAVPYSSTLCEYTILFLLPMTPLPVVPRKLLTLLLISLTTLFHFSRHLSCVKNGCKRAHLYQLKSI